MPKVQPFTKQEVHVILNRNKGKGAAKFKKAVELMRRFAGQPSKERRDKSWPALPLLSEYIDDFIAVAGAPLEDGALGPSATGSSSSAMPPDVEAMPVQPAPEIVNPRDAKKVVEQLAQLLRDGLLSEAELTAAKAQMLQLG